MGNSLSATEAESIRQKYSLPKEKFTVVYTSFKKHAGKDGKITRETFKEILAGVMHPELADKVFDSFDRDHSNSMDVREYLSMMGVTHGGSLEQKLEASFELFDKNGDGVLDRSEIRDMFIMIVKQKQRARGASDQLDKAAMTAIDSVIDQVFDKVDTDRSGAIDRAEFKNGFSQHPEVCGFFKQF
eukprot:TRINITY_DN525_c0_g1_i1.p1 TRINITY_DN525_c0_g1~~TRINITY_DN525_c0_g1_i1.p1  ORF type:complete len:203 (+),score=59.79 TRINITY_DN525_c0_g1_i1:54-611(+)